MTSETEAVLSSVDNTLARHRILGLVLREVPVPQAAYDFVSSEHQIVDGILKVSFRYFLPVTRRVRRQSAILGGDLELLINIWALPINTPLAIVSKRYAIRDDLESHEVHMVAPLRKDLTGIIW